MLKRFCTYYKPHLKIFTADMAAAFLLSVCTMIYPLITRQMLIDFIPNREVKLLVIWAAVLLGIYLVKYFLNYFVTYYGHVMGWICRRQCGEMFFLTLRHCRFRISTTTRRERSCRV